MTQQQISYINAMTNRANLAIAQQQADAATEQAKAAKMQAATAAKQQAFQENKQFQANFWTGAAATVGGLLAAILL